jgi:hypothetical protein
MTGTGIRSIGDEITLRRATANVAATAGGAGDNTLATGVIIDRAAIGWPESCVVAIPWTATLGAAATLQIGYALQHGDAANLSDATSFASAALATGATGAGTFAGTVEVNLRLTGAKRYVRLNFTPDLSAANTDTAALSGVIAFGGAGRLPQ